MSSQTSELLLRPSTVPSCSTRSCWFGFRGHLTGLLVQVVLDQSEDGSAFDEDYFIFYTTSVLLVNSKCLKTLKQKHFCCKSEVVEFLKRVSTCKSLLGNYQCAELLCNSIRNKISHVNCLFSPVKLRGNSKFTNQHI